MKMFKQIRASPYHVKERVYPKQVAQEGDVQRYGGMKMIRRDETVFAAYDKMEMRKAKILIAANSDFVHNSKSLFWPDVIMLAGVDLDLLSRCQWQWGYNNKRKCTRSRSYQRAYNGRGRSMASDKGYPRIDG